MLLTDTPNQQPVANQNQVDGYYNLPEAPTYDSDDDVDTGPHDISTSDFIILQSSFECEL